MGGIHRVRVAPRVLRRGVKVTMARVRVVAGVSGGAGWLRARRRQLRVGLCLGCASWCIGMRWVLTMPGGVMVRVTVRVVRGCAL